MILAWSLGLLAANLVAFGLMLWRGDWPERIAAPLIAIAILIEPLLYPVQIGTWRVGSGLLNLVLFLVLWVLAERADRWWLIVAAAIQLIIFITHLIPLMTGEFTTHTGVAIRSGLWVGISLTFFASVWEAGAARRFAREGASHVAKDPVRPFP